MHPNLKTRIFGILEPGDEDGKYFDPFIMGLIVAERSSCGSRNG
jgi:hypothetical protein